MQKSYGISIESTHLRWLCQFVMFIGLDLHPSFFMLQNFIGRVSVIKCKNLPCFLGRKTQELKAKAGSSLWWISHWTPSESFNIFMGFKFYGFCYIRFTTLVLFQCLKFKYFLQAIRMEFFSDFITKWILLLIIEWTSLDISTSCASLLSYDSHENDFHVCSSLLCPVHINIFMSACMFIERCLCLYVCS